MAEHSYTSRRELDQYAFHPAVTILAPLICILLQAILPKTFPVLAILDLPLIATLFFAVARRSPIAGAFTGTIIGLFQDGLTSLPFGVNGIAKGILGYFAASIGFTVDVENPLNRILLVFCATLLESGMLFLIERFVLGDRTIRLLWVHELIRAGVNTAVAVPLFYVLDRFRVRE